MKEQSIRTTVDIPVSLHRKLKAQAAAQGRSIRELILLGVRVTLVEGKRPRSRRVKFPLIVSDGPKVDLTDEQIYEHLEFLTRTPGWRFSGAATFTRKGQEHGLKVAAKRSSSSAESCKSLFFDF